MLELVEEAFDEITLAIEFAIDRALNLSVPLGWDMCPAASCRDEVDEVLPIVGAVANYLACGREAFQ